MSEKSLVEQIRHYQKDIERCPENTERMLRCIKRLYVLPITVQHLSETGVGRSVNGLRKLDGQVADAATALVAKWKAMVAAEDSECEKDTAEEHVEEEVKVSIPSEECNGTLSPERFSESQRSKDKENLRNNHPVKHKVDSKIKDLKESTKSEKDKKKDHSHRDRTDITHRSSSQSSSKDKVISSGKVKDKSSEKLKIESKSHHEKQSSGCSKAVESYSSKEKERKKVKHPIKDKKVEKHSKESNSLKQSSKHSKSKESSKIHRHSQPSGSDSEPEIKKQCKRKRSSQGNESSFKKIKIKQEPKSECSEAESEKDDYSYHSHASLDDNVSVNESRYSGTSSPEQMVKPDPNSEESDSDRSPPKRHSKSHHHKSSSHSKSKHFDKHSSSHKKKHSEDSVFTIQELEELIKQNEKMIKMEIVETHKKEKKSSNSDSKKSKIKIEANQDGSIDSGSGASFADALLGIGSVKKKKKKDEGTKKKTSVTSSPSKTGSITSSNRSSPAPSVSSSVGSSPSKPYKFCSTSDLMKEPEMLTKRIKLESPLDLDISSTLPEISTNYKPLPQIPEKVSRGASIDESAMFALMTTKNQRTKVFSGSNKKGYFAQVPSLYSFCIQVLYDNFDGLEFTGGVPYEILKPLLDKLSAEQLLGLEHFNPYLIEDTDSLWKFHANKDFKSKQKEEDETWREFYLRCIDERESKLKRLTSNIIESMAKSTPVRQAKLAYVDTVAKPPRNVARKQAKYGTGTGGSGESAKIAAASQNAQKKKEIVSKAVVGGFTPANPATDVVPVTAAGASPSPYNNPHVAAKLLKKKKAPLMAKALQLIKSNSRYKR